MQQVKAAPLFYWCAKNPVGGPPGDRTGGFASVLVLLRMYGNKFLGLFSKKRRLKAEIAEAELLGIEVDPETGQPVDPEAADALLGKTKDESSTIGDSA